MITDIFARRYAGVRIRERYYEEDRRFMNQAAVMIMDPLWIGSRSDKPSDTTERCLKAVHDTLALELGFDALSDRHWFHRYTVQGNAMSTAHAYSHADMCKNFLIKLPDDMARGDAWVKDRLSLVELAFRSRAVQVATANKDFPGALAKAELEDKKVPAYGGMRIPGLRANGVRALNNRINAAFSESVADLNGRLRQANYGLVYHNGMIQLADDRAIDDQVAKPFWALVAGPAWKNVDEQIKEAIDRRDRGDRTAAFHAVCALESAIKIISDQKGWSNGKEKGAANFVDNLNSKANGRFIEPWEAEMLKSMFSDVRNPFAHGPGQAPMPKLTPEQTDWAIDTAMAWVRNLIRRL